MRHHREIVKPSAVAPEFPHAFATPHGRNITPMTRRELLALAATCAAGISLTRRGEAAPADPKWTWETVTTAQLQAEKTPVLPRACLDRIATVDRAGPALNSVIELNPDALATATARDNEPYADNARSPLHGLP